MKALVGVDGSSNSLAAVEFIGRLLRPSRDEITLLYVTPDVSFGSEETLDAAVEERARTALSRAVLDEAKARLSGDWRSHAQSVEASGSPGAALLQLAEQRQAELIVVGFRGTGLFEQLMLGSVSRAVVHSATVPVLVVKTSPPHDAHSETPAGKGDNRLRVLTAFDGSAIGERIASLLNQIEWPSVSEGHVMTAVQPMFASELPDWLQQKARSADVAQMADAWRKEHDQNVEDARRELEIFRRKLPDCFAGQPAIVAEGRPAEQILSMLNKSQFDLVVLGSRGRGSVSRLLLGSTSSQVLGAAPCSVLIIR